LDAFNLVPAQDTNSPRFIVVKTTMGSTLESYIFVELIKSILDSLFQMIKSLRSLALLCSRRLTSLFYKKT